jgi:hypothetical protein
MIQVFEIPLLGARWLHVHYAEIWDTKESDIDTATKLLSTIVHAKNRPFW